MNKEIFVKRRYFTDKSTISEVSYEGLDRPMFILEDVDRGLFQTMPLKDILKIKKKGITAIPYGRYKLADTMSPRFKRRMLILLNVPGYEGIRIHPGVIPEHTEGCLTPGWRRHVDRISMSSGVNGATARLEKDIREMMKSNDVYINIVRHEESK